MAEFIQFIPVVEAQNLDGVAQPTFGNIEITGGGGVTSSILLSSDKSSVKIGDTFKVKIEVKTNTLAVSEYKLVLSYDRTVLTVIDQDTTTNGTQIKLLDDVFTVQDIEKNNTVNSTGTITLDAKTVSGNSFQVNKDVAEIQFQAQATGSPVIKVVQGASGSQLIRSNGSSLSFTTNEVTVQTSTQASTGSGNPTPIGSDGGTPSNGSTGGVVTIPNTAINDDIASVSGLFLGIFLIGTGIIIAKNKFSNRKPKDTLLNSSLL